MNICLPPLGFDVKIELLPDHVDRKMLKQRLECYGKIRYELGHFEEGVFSSAEVFGEDFGGVFWKTFSRDSPVLSAILSHDDPFLFRRAEVQYDWKTGDSLKHAYVTFAKEEEAEAATSAFCGRRRRQGIWVVDWCTSWSLLLTTSM